MSSLNDGDGLHKVVRGGRVSTSSTVQPSFCIGYWLKKSRLGTALLWPLAGISQFKHKKRPSSKFGAHQGLRQGSQACYGDCRRKRCLTATGGMDCWSFSRLALVRDVTCKAHTQVSTSSGSARTFNSCGMHCVPSSAPCRRKLKGFSLRQWVRLYVCSGLMNLERVNGQNSSGGPLSGQPACMKCGWPRRATSMKEKNYFQFNASWGKPGAESLFQVACSRRREPENLKARNG